MSATWDEIRARSESQWGGMTMFCGDCGMVFPVSGLPCRKHATPEESKLIDDQLHAALMSIGASVPIGLLAKRGPYRIAKIDESKIDHVTPVDEQLRDAVGAIERGADK